MKNVLFLFNGPYPNGNVTSNRVHYLCRGLIENGVDLDLVIIKPTEKKSNIRNTKLRGVYQEVNYQYISKQTVRLKNKFLAKLIDIVSYFKVFKLILINKGKYDTAIINGPFFDIRILFVLMLSLKKIKTIIEINEYPFVNKNNTFFKKIIVLIWRKLILPLFSGFIVITDNLKKEINKDKSSKSKIVVVPIIGEKVDAGLKIKEKSPYNFPYIFHAGSLYEEKDGILGAIKAFIRVKKEKSTTLKYVFTGKLSNASAKNDIDFLLKENKMENEVLFVGYLPQKEFDRYLQFASMAIVNKYSSMQNEYCFATKMIDYINYNIPIITTNIDSHKPYFKDGKNSFVVEPDKYELISEKIDFILENNNGIESLTNNAQKLLDKEFNYKYQAKRIISCFNTN